MSLLPPHLLERIAFPVVSVQFFITLDASSSALPFVVRPGPGRLINDLPRKITSHSDNQKERESKCLLGMRDNRQEIVVGIDQKMSSFIKKLLMKKV